MVALHLIPIHRALAIRFNSIGWDGQYAITPMFMDDNRWFSAGHEAMISREEAESAEEGSLLKVGEVEILFTVDEVVIQNKGLPFGRCNAAGFARSLEKAREAAAKTERWNKVVGIEESGVNARTLIEG